MAQLPHNSLLTLGNDKGGTQCKPHFGESFLPLYLKGQFSPKSKIDIFPVTCSAVYQSTYFWCESPSFGDISRRDFCLLANVMGLNGALNVVK